MYKQCTVYGVYDVRLGESKYFRHFVGKNFLYTAVVAFRRYGVTLLGVKRSGDPHICLNPGLKHEMGEGDICYYMWHTREEYTSVSSKMATADVNCALKHTSANMARITLALSGIDPAQLGRREEQSNARAGVGDDVISEAAPVSDQAKADSELHRGLQLFRYHSNIDRSANPVVKVCHKLDTEDHTSGSSAEGGHPVPRPQSEEVDEVDGATPEGSNDFVLVDMGPRQLSYPLSDTVPHSYSHSVTGMVKICGVGLLTCCLLVSSCGKCEQSCRK